MATTTDHDRIHDDDATPRYIGVEPPEQRYIDVREMMMHDAAVRLAEEVLNDEAEVYMIEYRKSEYARARDIFKTAQDAHERMWVHGMFPGWIVR